MVSVAKAFYRTASDWTMYPFSGENVKDIENLRSVYLDAVFAPLLRRNDFNQEGWRLEQKDLKDVNSDIQFKGVVYNEMKGAFSDSGTLFYTRAQQHLLKGTAYENVSGGDPPYITDLTYEDLVKFHSEHYHPSNCLVYTYGSGYKLEAHLNALDNVLAGFDKKQPLTTLEDLALTKFERPRRVTESCMPEPMGDPNKQTKLCVSFVTNNPNDAYESFVMRLLSYLLVDGQASPMFKALIDGNLGSEYTVNTGYDASTKPATFTVGLQGIKKEDCKLVEDTIFDVFMKSRDNIFDEKRIEAVLHQIEISMKNRTSNFGLGLGQSVVSAWSLGQTDLAESIRIESKIERLRKEMAEDKDMFKKRIEKYFLENKHCLIFTMEPQQDYLQVQQEQEAKRLSDKVSKLTLEEKENILQQSQELIKQQSEKSDVSCLPLLDINKDVPKSGKTFPVSQALVNDRYPVFWRNSATNGLSYFKAVNTIDANRIDDELVQLIQLYTSCLGSLGTKDKDAGEFEEMIRMSTGGISFSPFVSTSHKDTSKFQFGLTASGYTLNRNIDRFYSLLEEAWLNTNWENKTKLKTIITSVASSMSNSLADNGHRYAMKLAASSLSVANKMQELQSGISQVEWLNKLVNRIESTEELQKLSESLIDTSNLFLTTGNVRFSCIIDEAHSAASSANTERLDRLTNALACKPLGVPFEKTAFTAAPPASEALTKIWLKMPFSTNFSSTALKTIPYAHEDSVKLQVLSKLLTHHYLHREIREKNGAYGGGAAYSTDGNFVFYSYRDPNPQKSVSTFENSVKFACDNKFTAEDLNEAKLSILGSIDAPVSASAEGMNEFLYFVDDEMKQRRRELLLDVELSDLRDVAEKYLVNNNIQSSVVLAEESRTVPEGWTVRT